VTQLVVTPIDMSAKGSHGQRKQLLRAIARIRTFAKEQDFDALLEGLEMAEAILRERAETDDGTSVEDAFAQCSADDFDAMLSAVLGQETVPNPNAAS
jgi:predicted xylose isomerase-like sugar epimerase